MLRERIQPCCVLAVKHAAVLGSPELQELVRTVIEHLSQPFPTDSTELLNKVEKRERRAFPIVGRDGLWHDSPDHCVLRALVLLLRMSQRRARQSDYITVLNHCAAAADMFDREIRGGNFYSEECSYHNKVLNPMIHGNAVIF